MNYTALQSILRTLPIFLQQYDQSNKFSFKPWQGTDTPPHTSFSETYSENKNGNIKGQPQNTQN